MDELTVYTIAYHDLPNTVMIDHAVVTYVVKLPTQLSQSLNPAQLLVVHLWSRSVNKG
jgi:hypothetical protein